MEVPTDNFRTKGKTMQTNRLTLPIVIAVLLLGTGLAWGNEIPIQSPDDFVKPKPAQVISSRTIDYLSSHAVDGTVKIWVFFSDRGITSKSELSQAASTLSNRITDEALGRRKKVGKDKFTIIDVPVKSSYVEAVVNLGAKLRHTSRYLNAASFEVPVELLDEISELPFVIEIRPMIAARKTYPQESDAPKDGSSNSLESPILNYGASFDQLNQINVIPAHTAGYAGQGVIVAMFDTGFRTTHHVFQDIMFTGRLIAEHDFVFDDGNVDNEPEDWSNAWDHGTLTWSTLGGAWDGNHYGPAYGARFILAKTEDIRSETPVEEDNWVAAVEWSDSIGADVISSSLSYSDWYDPSDYDGNTATSTVAADLAAEYGIVVCNSAGNAGPYPSTIGAPADADSILTVGAVFSTGGIIGFSSRGPTADGRIKPEVCARGSGTACASASSDEALTTASGTSLSCPLIGGVAALVIQAHPDWTAMQVREAIMMTADNATTPNNDYGWGIANCWAAINYSFGPPAYVAGDADGSGDVDIDDVVYIIAFVFTGGPSPVPVEASGDADGSGEVDIDDVIYLIAYIFTGGPPPVV
ncbi:MAG: S8 family serine peptidase [candidate division Zixibacteria bacterium]|nr:S8 family serine peptidase [candidate division Zixibacteria bacterium]